MAPRVVVYLGASQPVHATHVRLVRTLLSEGHDRVFVFLLRWRPERFGTSADSAAEHLRGWLSAEGGPLTPADLSRLTLQVVQHDHEAGSRMRAALGAGVDADVEVCFSQKYADETERIERDWLPIYRSEFPAAKPRFLTDEIDPGAVPCGTAKFADALQRYRDAKGGDGEASATDDLNQWRPEHVAANVWIAYVDGLLAGAGGEPFYVPAEKAELEGVFFADTDVLRVLDTTWRERKVPGGAAAFLGDKGNWGTFWKKHATDTDEALFKQFCLRRRGILQPSALECMPIASPASLSAAVGAPLNAARRNNQQRFVVLAAPAMHMMAERLVASDPGRFEYFVSKWRKFPDGTDNITLGGFEPEDKVSRRDVLFLASFDCNDTALSQLHALTFLCESAFLSSLTILLAYLPTGTMERYLQPGRVAAANTTAKLLSQLPATGSSRTRVMIYDVHALPTQYFFTGNAAATLHSACPLVVSRIESMPADSRIDCVAFPDDGAAKRFGKFFQSHLKGAEIVTCNKVRTEGNKRVVVISEGQPEGRHVLIVDDLVQTGGTLYECAVKLREAGAKSVSGFVVHGVFPNESWRRFLRGGDRDVFSRFWLSSSNPAVLAKVPGGDVFEVLDLAPRIARDLVEEPSGRAAWS
eukprot:TRINITY_DN29249_c0_g2_i1.p1 TRINITY_DN29249_c0_g2~~TRINITY_DN29249_c0_g2_i1.p1  ORF type:complete len:642 (+),score=147.78 TRINITY_DN29249_c0_g2_i1:79-2004(+)